MARVPLNAYGQSRYTDQLLQTVLIPTVVTNSVNGDDFYTIETDISTSTLHADTVYAGTVNTSIIGLGDLATKTLALGSQSLQGDYTSKTDTTVIGVRAAGNDNFRGTFDGNVLIGAETGLNLCNTNYSTYIGANSGTFGQATSNVVVGYGACVGISGTPTVGNVILGAGAGLSNTGNSNVFIGLNAGANVTVSNTLIVHNTSSSVNPLLYGRFDSRQLGVNCVPTRNFQVSGSTLLNGDLTVSGNIAIAGSLSGLTTLGINCIPTVAFQVSGSTILKNLSASNVLTRTLGVNYVPTIDTVSLGTTFGVSGRTFFNGDVTVLGTITGAVAPTGISGFAADLHGGGHGYYGGVSLSDSKITLSGTITTLSSTTNYIGGVYLLNSNVSLGGNISNVSSSTNFIGGVYLRNSNISFDGTISNNTAYANRIGDVYLVNGDISFGQPTGKITTFSNTSNFIGGVTLSGGRISNISTTSNFIGGVYLQNSNISLAGSGSIKTISTTSNSIGGVGLSNGFIIGNGSMITGIAPQISVSSADVATRCSGSQFLTQSWSYAWSRYGNFAPYDPNTQQATSFQFSGYSNTISLPGGIYFVDLSWTFRMRLFWQIGASPFEEVTCNYPYSNVSLVHKAGKYVVGATSNAGFATISLPYPSGAFPPTTAIYTVAPPGPYFQITSNSCIVNIPSINVDTPDNSSGSDYYFNLIVSICGVC